MRALADEKLIRRFMRELGAAATEDVEAYLTGGATAVLHGWRESTLDIALALVPDRDELLRALPRIKNELNVNVELVSPSDFVPAPRGGTERAIFVAREGKVSFFHADPYAQALAKLERGHARDLEDVSAFLEHGLVEPHRLLDLFGTIEPALYRYPAVDPAAFRRRVERVAADHAA